MTTPAPTQNAEHLSRRVLPLILLLFVCSGAAALIYEVVWFQLLQLVIGSSAISLAVLLATFMGGMCIGSLLFPRYAPRMYHPLRLYAMLEIGIGIIGLLELFLIPVSGRLYSPAVGYGAGALLLRAVVAGLCLLPPTVLMGATLPAMARWVESSPRGISWVGFLYGANIVGAVFGSVTAGFYLLRVYDQAVAIYVAVALNILIGVVGLSIAPRSSGWNNKPVNDVPAEPAEIATIPRARLIYISIAISGGCALAAEVVWTRLLSLTFGGSVYTFSLILGVFLSGLGLGSAVAARWSRSIASSRLALVWCQVLVTVGIAWAAALIYVALPNWPISPALAPSPWFTMQLDLVRCALVVFPAAVLWGASFPFALTALSVPGADASRLVGRVYAVNTVGAITGATLCALC